MRKSKDEPLAGAYCQNHLGIKRKTTFWEAPEKKTAGCRALSAEVYWQWSGSRSGKSGVSTVRSKGVTRVNKKERTRTNSPPFVRQYDILLTNGGLFAEPGAYIIFKSFSIFSGGASHSLNAVALPAQTPTLRASSKSPVWR